MNSDTPAKCRQCDRSEGPACRFCSDLEFDELVLCDLNRAAQERGEFVCGAFRPKLQVVGEFSGIEPGNSRPSRRPRLREEVLLDRLESEQLRADRQRMCEQLRRDVDATYVELRYHFAWNVARRAPVFRQVDDCFRVVYDSFIRCSETVGGFASLLWLAPDHVHVYVESNGEKTVEEIHRQLKCCSADYLAKRLPPTGLEILPGEAIWDDAYFVETVGFPQV